MILDFSGRTAVSRRSWTEVQSMVNFSGLDFLFAKAGYKLDNLMPNQKLILITCLSK